MPNYECILIGRQDLSSNQVETLVEQVGEIISQNGGEITKKEFWGLRTLAYRIKKNRKGHYVLLNIVAPHPAVAEMERVVRLNEDVLRHLVVRVDELEEGPSAMLQARNDRRDDRGPRRGPGGDRGDRGDRGERRDRHAPAESRSEGVPA